MKTTEEKATAPLDPLLLGRLLQAARQAPNHYAALSLLSEVGVGASTQDAQIRQAWLTVCRRYHPDKVAAQPSLVQALCAQLTVAANLAYAALCTAAARKQYTAVLRGRGSPRCAACDTKGVVRARQLNALGKLAYADTLCPRCGGAGYQEKNVRRV